MADDDSATDSDAVEEYDSFAQPTLIDQLKKILDEYPDDGQIIKELIQNADDAGAQCMKILYVGHPINPQHPGEQKYRKFLRGPALVFYNDARFTKDDWTGIRTIYNSVKADDPLTVGRFGLGFKSVFHITDYPCIVSGSRILFLNPLEKELGKVCVTIKLQNLQRSKTIDVNDVLLALNDIFGFSKDCLDNDWFPGTIFWFPLRSEPTKLSPNMYTESKVMDLFKAFMADAETSLLFLKGLKSIQLFCEVNTEASQSSMAPKPFPEMNFGTEEEFFSVELNEHGNIDNSSKSKFVQEIKDLKGAIPQQSMHYLLNCSVHIKRRNMHCKVSENNYNWSIVNLYPGEPMDEQTKSLIGDKDLCYSPLVSVAACKEYKTGQGKKQRGKIFCFQPLPEDRENQTGLPIHLNAFFALTQNRRNVKWPSAEQEKFKMNIPKAIEWNLTLMSDILPEAYVSLLLGIIDHSDPSNDRSIAAFVVSALPDVSNANYKWKPLAEKVFDLLVSHRFLFTEANGGQWISVEEAVFALPDCEEAIKDLLLKSNVNLVETPDHIMSANTKLRSATRVCPRFIHHLMAQRQTYRFLRPDQKIQLLHYLWGSEYKEHLDDLELLPLENRGFDTFGQGEAIYLVEKDISELFPGLEGHFAATELGEVTLRILEEMAENEDYQIRRLDERGLQTLIQKLMKEEFESLLPPLKVDKNRSKRWKVWIENIWKLILSKFPDAIHLLAKANIPIFPVFSKRPWSKVVSFSLCPLSFRLLSSNDKDDKQIPAQLCSAFELLSVNIVYRLPAWLESKAIEEFVHTCSGPSIVALMSKLEDSNISYFNEHATDSQQSLLLTFLAEKVNKGMLTKRAISLLSKIKMFKEKEFLGPKYTLVSAQQSSGILVCQEFPTIPFPKPLLDLGEKSEEETLAVTLGVKKLGIRDMVLQTLYIIETYLEEDVITFMLWIVNNHFHEKYDDVKDIAKGVPFLLVNDNVFRRPNELYDPSDDLLVSLFDGFQVFPTDERFTNSKILHALRCLGLKTRTCVKAEEVYNICKRLHELGSYRKGQCTGSQVLKFLNLATNRALLHETHVSNLKWIPVQDNNKAAVLRYQKGKGVLVSPLEVKSSEYRDIVSSVAPLIDCSKYEQLADHFKWNTPPEIGDVTQQLYVIAKNYTGKKKADFLPHVLAIYKWLDALDSPRDVKDVLEDTFYDMGLQYIWTGNGFKRCKDVVVKRNNSDIDMKPFLWFLPSEISELSEFFKSIGCKSKLTSSDYKPVLDQIKDISDQSDDGAKPNGLLQLVILILNEMKTCVEHGHIDISQLTIYVPVQSDGNKLVMKAATECTYGNLDDTAEEGLTSVHEDVPVRTAKAVGVKSFKQQMLSGLEGLEEWGQTEPLTRRLRNLLKEGYIDGFSVPKELFQNADDAKASKLWILYDERENEYARKGLLNDGMSEVQGPALWIYNNAVFTEADFKNITKLSGATKQTDSSKIGKFGLGFCSVYNLTDVPSFLSNDSIVMFDPHTSFLGTALPGKSPGLRINLNKDRSKVRRFYDQFMPFENIFGCTKMHEMSRYNGTLFRLPLRTKKGQISDIIYRDVEIKELLSKVKQYASNLLIFSQSVTELKLFHLEDGCNPSDMKLVFSCHKSLKQTIPKEVTDSSVLLKASQLKDSGTIENTKLQILQSICIETNDPEGQYSSILHWLLSWSTGRQKASFKEAEAEPGAIPLAAIALPFDCGKGENEVKNFESLPNCFYSSPHFFCFLPLPIEHDFPFHINALFAVSSDRRRLLVVGKEDKSSVHQKWNECLMRDAVVEALVHMLENMIWLGKTIRHPFYKIWPKEEHIKRSELKTLNTILYKRFYKFIVENDSRVFEKDGKWFRLSECVFLDQGLRSKDIGGEAFEILNRFPKEKIAIDIPTEYYTSLHDADKVCIEERTVTTEAFYLEYFLPNLSLMPVGSKEDTCRRNLLLKHSISIRNENIDRWMKANKCVPTKPKNELKLPSEVIDRKSKIGPLFSDSDGRFPIELFEEINNRLHDLGILHSVLPDALLFDRAKKMEQLNKKCTKCTLIHFNLLVKYIFEKQPNDEKAWDTLRTIPFFPVASRPIWWPSQWEAETVTDFSEQKTKCCKDHKGDKSTKKLVLERAPMLFIGRYRALVGCSFSVFDSDSLSQSDHILEIEEVLRNKMHMKGKKDIRPDIVLEQLTVFSQTCQMTFKEFDAKQIDNVMKEIYKFLNDQKSLPSLELPDESIVWTSTVFVNPNKVAHSLSQLDCTPYLFDLEKSPLRNFKALCTALKIKPFFSPEDILGTLTKLAGEASGKPILEANRKAVINIIECLKLTLRRSQRSYNDMYDSGCGVIYAPDKEWILRDASALCFDDESGVDISDTMILVNEGLTIGTAKAIGIKSKLAQKMHDTSDSIEFFQGEPLVTRLNNILSGYPCDGGIFKELIQNADDAGANEIHLLLDVDEYGDDVFDESYTKLQGPALCVFNDKPFTQKDLKGIQSLGKGSKGDDPSKTGQYGVGFNSVYNLTDAPSFFTKGPEIENGETLCIFDPMAMFLHRGFVTRERPGRRFKDINTIRSKHKDVIPPYNERYFGMDKQGTVFRFPLRMANKGYTSDIKENDISPKVLEGIMNHFKDEASECLIFLKNLCKIKISSKKRGHISLETEIMANITTKDLKAREDYFEKHSQMCKTFKQDRASIFSLPTKTVSYRMSIKEENKMSGKTMSDYIIVQTVGYRNYVPPGIIQDKCKSGELGLLPQGGVATVRKTNAKLSDQGTTENKSFCFLPLPGETGLPVHIHGHFALDHEGRRGLWKADNFDQTSCHRTLWNKSLIEGVITPAYLHLIETIKNESSKSLGKEIKAVPKCVAENIISDFNKCLPLKETVKDNYWLLLLKQVYKQLVEQERPFLPSLSWNFVERKKVWTTCLRWVPLQSANDTFPSYSTDVDIHGNTMDEKHRHAAYTLSNILSDTGMTLVSVSKHLEDSLDAAGVPIESLSPRVVLTFLGSHSQCRKGDCLIKTNTLVTETVVKSVHHMCAIVNYCIKDQKSFLELVNKVPIFITVDNIVRTATKETPLYVTHFNDLFENAKTKFLGKEIADIILIKRKEFLSEKSGLKAFLQQDFKSLLSSSAGFKLLFRKDILRWDKVVPTLAWIRRVWHFFEDETVCKQSDNKNKETEIKELLRCFNEVAIIPAYKKVSGGSDGLEWYLIPPCTLPNAMDVSHFQKGTLKCAFEKLNVLAVDAQFGEKAKQTFEQIMKVVANANNPKTIVKCLHLNKHQISEANLSTDEAEAILNYIADTFGDLNNVGNILKGLPLFINHQNKLVSMSSFSKSIVFPAELPLSGLDNILRVYNFAFLKTWKQVNKLYKNLGVVVKTSEEIYVELILPNQSKLTRGDFGKHLEYLSTNVLQLTSYGEKELTGKKKQIIDMLTSCSFIQIREQRFVKASELFSSREKMFSLFCQKDELLPEAFNKDCFIRLFEMLGLKTKMTVPLFKRFAGEIAENGKQLPISQALRNKSGRLLKVFTDMQREIEKETGFQNLARVSFIIPSKIPEEYVDICEACLKEDRMVSFVESVFYDELEIAWTVCPVLPKALKINDEIRTKLMAKPSLRVKNFVDHCRNVGQKIHELHEKPTEKQASLPINRVMNSLYEHLQKNKGEIGESELGRLSRVPFVYFATDRLIHKAKDTIIECSSEEEVRPYLSKMPISLGKFCGVFKALGALEKPNVWVYIGVLCGLKEKCKDTELLKSDLPIAQAAIRNMLNHKIKGNENANADKLVLFLPTIHFKMEDARSVIICDNKYIRKRLRNKCSINYFLGLDKLEIQQFDDEQCLKFFRGLPQNLQPMPLSEIVEEVIDSAAVSETPSVLVRNYESFIKSSHYSRGLLRLVKHAFSDEMKAWNSDMETLIQRKLRQIKLVSVSGMRTTLHVKPYENGVFGDPKRVPHTEEIKTIHVEESETATKIFVETRSKEWQDELNKTVVQYMNKVLKSPLTQQLFVTLLDFSKHIDRPAEIENMLDKKKIVSHTFSSFEEASIFAKPGTLVPPECHEFLDSGYGVFYEHDFNCAAYELYDSLFQPGCVEDRQSFVYVRILRRITHESGNPLLDSYEIDVGEDEPIQVGASCLYKLVRKPPTGTEVVLYTRQNTSNEGGRTSPSNESERGDHTSSTKEPKGEEELSIDTVCKEIKDTLTEAFRQDETNRKRIVKRLWIKWHPDKNHGKEQFATKVFQYIQYCIAKLEKGGTPADYSDGTDDTQGSGKTGQGWRRSRDAYDDYSKGSGKTGGPGQGWRRSRYASDDGFWGSFFDGFDARFRRERERSRSGASHRDRWESFYEFPESDRQPCPWPHEARKWQRQAREDLEFAKHCLQSQVSTSNNWICFVCHQAAETSLRAAWFAKDANKRPSETTTDLMSIAAGLFDPLQELARKITRITRDRRHMTHPNVFVDTIPAHRYTRTDAESVFAFTSELIQLVTDFYVKM